tara:strand:+ start:227 stop:598 length:372 start_codon:yes stop_codon:yes gene_type:complete
MGLNVKRSVLALIAFVFITGFGCGGSAEERLTCEDILPEGKVGFKEVSDFLQFECGWCHNATNPVNGYDFSTPKAAYKSSLYKADIIYTQMALGEMPPSGARLEDEYLRRFRTWYCRGALYEN